MISHASNTTVQKKKIKKNNQTKEKMSREKNKKKGKKLPCRLSSKPLRKKAEIS